MTIASLMQPASWKCLITGAEIRAQFAPNQTRFYHVILDGYYLCPLGHWHLIFGDTIPSQLNFTSYGLAAGALQEALRQHHYPANAPLSRSDLDSVRS